MYCKVGKRGQMYKSVVAISNDLRISCLLHCFELKSQSLKYFKLKVKNRATQYVYICWRSIT